MIEITSMSQEFDSIDKYLLTVSPTIKTIKELDDGFKIPVVGFLEFTDVKEATGEEVEILSIMTPDKEVYSCQSKTFKRSFKDIFNVMEGKPFTIIKTSGINRSGRPFVNCILDVSSVTSAE